MSVALLRIIWALYVGVFIYALLNAVSEFVFNKNPLWKRIGKRTLLAPFWPLAILSKSGRKFLFKTSKEL